MNTTAPATEHQAWLQHQLAGLMEMAPTALPVDVSLLSLGVDSLVAVRLAGLISDRLGINVDPLVMFDHPTIEGLAAYLDGQRAPVQAAASEAP